MDRGTSAREPARPRQTAKDRALGLLAVRWRSREELRRRLRQAGYGAEEIEPTLTDLAEAGLIEDSRFARELVRDQATRRMSGDRAIRNALWEKGVAADVAEEALGEAGDEAERALRLAARRAGRLRGLAPEVAYRRLFGLMLRRGFPPALAAESCRRALSDVLPKAEVEPSDG